MSSPTLPADPVPTEDFGGVTVPATRLDPERLADRRVGVIARTPAYVRVLPTVVEHAARTKLFLTRPVDVVPPTRLGTTAQLVPPLARVAARLHRWRAVVEPELRRKLTPLDSDGPVAVSAEFHRAAQHPRCEVVAWPIAAVVDAGVRTADGLEHRVDVLVTC